MIEWSGLLSEHDRGTPASEDVIGRAEARLGLRLPADFRRFLLWSDGYRGSVGDQGFDADLWSADEIASGGYEGPEDAGVVLIGSNGGPTGYGVLPPEANRFVSIPLASSDPGEIRHLGGSFAEFLRAIADGDGY
ncbi:SMI1/KNR4 family protein [Microbacterium sp. ZW T5_56]|uniref:SMI1/KNR4 family protein n=1 Tax=Microbacterium sp. ZW T5_56 TaxID=3378081 RepID=UPI003852094F